MKKTNKNASLRQPHNYWIERSKWIEIDYEYNGETASIAELGYETAICRLESLTSAGAKILRVEEQRGDVV